MSKTNRETFHLRKVKVVGGGGLMAEYTRTEKEGKTSYVINETMSSPILPHATLSELIHSLQATVILELGLNAGKSKKVLEYMQEKVEITGCSGVLAESNVKLVITSKLTATRGQVVALNTPNLTFEDTHDAYTIYSEIEDEVFAYLYNGKRAQLEMDFESPEMQAEMDKPEEGQTSKKDLEVA